MARNHRSEHYLNLLEVRSKTYVTFTRAGAMWGGLSYVLLDLLSSLLREIDHQ